MAVFPPCYQLKQSAFRPYLKQRGLEVCPRWRTCLPEGGTRTRAWRSTLPGIKYIVEFKSAVVDPAKGENMSLINGRSVAAMTVFQFLTASPTLRADDDAS